MGEPVLLETEGLCVRRGGRRVLDGVSLRLERGPPFALVGESGSGKTTLLLALLGLVPVEAGRFSLDGATLAQLDDRERARRVGIVFQDFQLFPHLTATQNVGLAPRLHGLADVEARTRALLDGLGLAGLGDRRPHELSGGQKQRVAIARSLALEPRVLFLDEPSAALDPRTTRELALLLTRLNDTTQVVIVSHDHPFLDQCCPRAALLESGRLTRLGPPADLLQPHEVPAP